MTAKPYSPPLWQKLRERLEALPLPPTEDSLLFRILVQTLVIVGIIATDVAAETQMSFWAIPLSIGGATWSWYHRRKRNIGAKFVLALGMIIVLVVFLGNLVVKSTDSRLALAQLLIQLQVLHSFDLPRRKDLGYSAIIGLILLGVGGTISQTLGFAPWLVLFLLLSLPTLILDYRSRLGLEAIPLGGRFNLPSSPSLSPQRLLPILGTVLLLGLTLFTIMPRFPSYQIQSFPVSEPEQLKNQGFDEQNKDIINPGYVKEGTGTGKGGIGSNKSSGPGKVDQTYYYGFNEKMNQNLRGSMKPELVMRVRSQLAGFWRVLAFDRYTGQGWEVSRQNKLQNLGRSWWSYRFFISPPPALIPTKEIIQSYSIVSSLPNLIPVLSYPQSIFFPTKEIGIDPEGSLRSPGVLVEGLTYTVISAVPFRPRTLLNSAPTVYSPIIKEHYLQIPPQIKESVRNQALKLLAKSPKPLTSNYEKALFLTQALKQNYEIKEDLPFFAEKEDLVTAFLFRYGGGYPDHFATVLTMMLRSLGIPARLAVGFGAGQFNPFTGYYLVHNTDAHAITEVFFPNYGWFSFDGIPGHDLIPPSVDEPQAFNVLKQFWNWVASWLPSPIVAALSFLWSLVMNTLLTILAKIWQFIAGSILGLLVGLIGAVLLGWLCWLAFLQLVRWGDRRRLAKLAPMERLYIQMLQILQQKGYSKHPAQTPLEYAHSSQAHLPDSIAAIIAEISQAYSRWRYGQYSPDLQVLQQKLDLLGRLVGRHKNP